MQLPLYESSESSRPSFIPEGYLPLAEAIEVSDCDWNALRQQLWAGDVRGFILTTSGRLIAVPKEDWLSPKNDNADSTGQVTKLNRAITGGRDLTGFGLIMASDLKPLKSASKNAPSTVDVGTSEPIPQQKSPRRGRTKGSGSYAEDDEPLLEEMQDLIDSKKVKSVWEAANQLASEAKGNATPENKARRLYRRFNSTRS